MGEGTPSRAPPPRWGNRGTPTLSGNTQECTPWLSKTCVKNAFRHRRRNGAVTSGGRRPPPGEIRRPDRRARTPGTAAGRGRRGRASSGPRSCRRRPPGGTSGSPATFASSLGFAGRVGGLPAQVITGRVDDDLEPCAAAQGDDRRRSGRGGRRRRTHVEPGRGPAAQVEDQPVVAVVPTGPDAGEVRRGLHAAGLGQRPPGDAAVRRRRRRGGGRQPEGPDQGEERDDHRGVGG